MKKITLWILCIFWLFSFLPVWGQEYLSVDGLLKSGSLWIAEGWQMGYHASGILDTVQAKIVIEKDSVLTVINGYAVRERYAYWGDRMPNNLPNNGGIYDDYYVTKKYLYSDKTEILKYVWMSIGEGKKSE